MKHRLILPILLVIFLMSCNDQSSSPSKDSISQLNLKRGQIISCGNQDHKFGIAHFDITGDTSVQNDFDLAVELLHSFEYEESEKAFAKIIDEQPKCAMAYWGVAYAFGPHVNKPMDSNDVAGAWAALQQAVAAKDKVSPIEQAYITALEKRYQPNYQENRLELDKAFANAMRELAKQYPDDLVRAALDTALLRRKAAGKFSRADQM